MGRRPHRQKRLARYDQSRVSPDPRAVFDLQPRAFVEPALPEDTQDRLPEQSPSHPAGLGRTGSRLSEQAHRSDPRILGRRTLARDHCRLVRLLQAGKSVLDIGCGTGAITADIARAVGPNGRVVGLERDTSLVAL